MKKLILIFHGFILLYSCHSQTAVPDPTSNSPYKIPIDAKRWYQLNNLDFRTDGLIGLFDGKLNERVNTGYGKVLDRYDSYYPLADGEEMTIDSIRFYDGAGAFVKNPMIFSVINDKWKRIRIASFNGQHYNMWVGPDPNNPKKFALKTPVKKVRYLVITSTSSSFPNEIEIFGTYKAGNRQTAPPKRKVQLKQALGVNAFEWNFEDSRRPTQIDETRMNAVKSFRGVRHYLDWQRIEPRPGRYTFNPSHNGGWNYDTIYERCKTEGIEVLVCLKTIPSWMKSTYPSNMQDVENVPAKYGKNLSDPRSYIEQAKLGFQFAARYGGNTKVNTALINVYKGKRWKTDPENELKKGLGLVKYIECDNERDKWWKGRKAYQTAREYAANMSAFYDGHKNTMGPGVGVKNADPGMQVVMGGLAGANIDYVKGMIDWCKEFRGYNADGTVNLCWDVINYHYYSNDEHNSQNGKSTRGAAPEVSGAAEAAMEFVQLAHESANGMPVWVTETGYDINQQSPLKAIAINNKTPLQTQADWILRTSLLYTRLGIEGVFFYQMYDNIPSHGGRFNTSGLVNDNRSRRPAADFLFQANRLIGKYFYKETVNSNPIVDRYELNNQSAWVLVVPDERGKTANYTLDLGKAGTAFIYRPRAGQDSMSVEAVKTNNGKLSVRVTETPVFVLPGAANQTTAKKTAAKAIDTVIETPSPVEEKEEVALNIYPNPTRDFFYVELNNKSRQEVKVDVFTANGGLCQTHQFKKYSDRFLERIALSATLPFGIYFIEIKQGAEKFVKRIIKSPTANNH